ncbi:MAG: hypothetical protein JXR41_08585, partial [Bacteroidales bacterium]|nr:hypothetical protein [Bacteroidales bacterium]
GRTRQPAITLVLVLLISASIDSHAQQFEWKTGFFGFFDNREYFNEFIIPQTIGGASLSAEAGFAINPHNRFRAGLGYTYEYGSKGDYLLPDVILYFKGEWKPVTFYIGSFPRHELIEHPLAMMTDTLLYYRPMVEGMYIEHRREWGYQNIWLDWTSRQTDTKRETFLIGATGRIHKGLFLFQHHFLMYHFAGPAIDIPGDHIRDNGGYCAMPGLNLGHMLGLDTATLSTGFLMSYDQLRHVYDMRFMWGSLTDVNVNHKGFGIHGVYYRGDSQVHLYGDGFYKSSSYGRADVYYQKAWQDKIAGKLTFSFHFLPGNLDFSFAVHIRACMDGSVKFGE